MHQSTTPSLSQTIWPRWASRKFLTLRIVQTLLPVTFGYSLNSRETLEAVVMRQLRRWKRLWQRSLIHSHKRTSMGPSRSCWNGTTSRRRLLRRWLEFYACTINKSAHMKKVWKFIVCSLYIYAYNWRCAWHYHYCHEKRNWWPRYKSLTKLFVVHFMLRPLEKTWIHLFSG